MDACGVRHGAVRTVSAVDRGDDRVTTRTARAKAKRGAAFLDAKLGRGWRRKIRRRDLAMQVGSYERGECGCILAQLYGDYFDGARHLGIAWGDDVRSLGFESSGDTTYGDLTEAWLEVLREKA